MAKQVGDTIITKTIDNLVFYKMDDKGYVRRKSSLTRKQFKTSKRFANSRKSAERFAKGNRIASDVYKTIPASERSYSMFVQLKSSAIALLKAGTPDNEVKIKLTAFIPTLH
jgi:hypothetical protein